ncbi:ribonuclease E/G [Meridianimarinicoccus sp. MJW13]|uniref:ribonuclease E/G n=1 Tax=Meridianimarinicoccus sp. MJW13 TaxID=2720031 RepID=UPI001868BDF6|nr:ribonuclease E/G [Fluviibacterium sp. MJW13]
MKGCQILISQINGRMAAARIVDGQLDDLLIDTPDHIPRPGAIYRGTVGRPMKGQGGRIITLTDGTNGFLRQGHGLSEGQAVLIQVSGFAEGGKAVPVTPRLLFKSRYAIITPDAPGLNISRAIKDEEARVRLKEIAHAAELPDHLGLILRSAAEMGDDDAVADDIAEMAGLAAAILAEDKGAPELLLDGPTPDLLAWREWVDVADHNVLQGDQAFDHGGAAERLETLSDPREPLPEGGCFYVEPTRALVAIDVNTGPDTSPAAGLKANIATARALPRALRLRGLGGQIVLDLAPMPKKERRTFEQVLRAACRACPVETTPVGWTPMGHFELQRKRERLPLNEALS